MVDYNAITDVILEKTVQYLLLGMLKSLYPKMFMSKINMSENSVKMFRQANGSDEVYNILKKEKYVA